MFLTNSPQCVCNISSCQLCCHICKTLSRGGGNEHLLRAYCVPVFSYVMFPFLFKKTFEKCFLFRFAGEEVRHLWSLICLSHRGPVFKYCSVSPQVWMLFYLLFFSGLVSTVITKGRLCWVPKECIPWKTLVSGVEVMLWDLTVKAVSVLWERIKSAAFSEERWFQEGLSWFEVAAITSLGA